jgi:hypothetical protein
MTTTPQTRGAAVRAVADALADRTSFVATVPPAMLSTVAEALAGVPEWSAYLDCGIDVVPRFDSDPSALSAILGLTALADAPVVGVVTIPKTVPADAIGRASGQHVPDDASRDVLIIDEGEHAPVGMAAAVRRGSRAHIPGVGVAAARPRRHQPQLNDEKEIHDHHHHPRHRPRACGRIVGAYNAAHSALVELSNTIHDAAQAPEYDEAIAAAYVLAYEGPAGAEGIPTELLGSKHGDRLLLLSADIRQQLEDLHDAAYEVPSDLEPDPRPCPGSTVCAATPTRWRSTTGGRRRSISIHERTRR